MSHDGTPRGLSKTSSNNQAIKNAHIGGKLIRKVIWAETAHFRKVKPSDWESRAWLLGWGTSRTDELYLGWKLVFHKVGLNLGQNETGSLQVGFSAHTAAPCVSHPTVQSVGRGNGPSYSILHLHSPLQPFNVRELKKEFRKAYLGWKKQPAESPISCHVPRDQSSLKE